MRSAPVSITRSRRSPGTSGYVRLPPRSAVEARDRAAMLIQRLRRAGGRVLIDTSDDTTGTP